MTGLLRDTSSQLHCRHHRGNAGQPALQQNQSSGTAFCEGSKVVCHLPSPFNSKLTHMAPQVTPQHLNTRTYRPFYRCLLGRHHRYNPATTIATATAPLVTPKAASAHLPSAQNSFQAVADISKVADKEKRRDELLMLILGGLCVALLLMRQAIDGKGGFWQRCTMW